MKTVAIFGTGPAALAAAHGIRTVAPDTVLHFYTDRPDRPSRLNGCQYLHAPLPGVGDPTPHHVSYSLAGSRQEYAKKVYGPHYNGQVSVDDYEGEHAAWDLRSAYRDLWAMYSGQAARKREVDPTTMHKATIDPEWLSGDGEPWFADYVISTIPAQALCMRDCTFASEEVWAVGDAPELGQRLPWIVPDNTIICNGAYNPSWYRAARVFGYQTREWPGHGPKPFCDDAEVVRVTKPLFTNCRCWQGFNDRHIIRMGRFGKWSKRAYVHDCFAMGASLMSHGINSLYSREERKGLPFKMPDGVKM